MRGRVVAFSSASATAFVGVTFLSFEVNKPTSLPSLVNGVGL